MMQACHPQLCLQHQRLHVPAAAAACRLRGLLFRVVGLGMQLGLLGIIIGTRTDIEWYRLLAGGYALTRASISCTHAIVAWTLPRARKLCVTNACSGMALSIAPAVLAWQATHEEAYSKHLAIMVVVTVGECTCLCRGGVSAPARGPGGCDTLPGSVPHSEVMLKYAQCSSAVRCAPVVYDTAVVADGMKHAIS